VPSAQPPPRSVPFESHGFLRPPRPATREIRGQMGASGFRGQAAGRQAAARPSRARATTRHARTAQRTEASGGGRPACADHDPAVGQRVRHGHLPRDQAASVNGSLPAAREADRGVGPFHPGDMYLLSSGTPAGPARCISRVLASGLVTGPEQAAYAGSDAPQGRWGPTGRTRGPVTGRPNAAAVPAADAALRGEMRSYGYQLLRRAVAGPCAAGDSGFLPRRFQDEASQRQRRGAGQAAESSMSIAALRSPSCGRYQRLGRWSVPAAGLLAPPDPR
jgi:hypothetical protein